MSARPFSLSCVRAGASGALGRSGVGMPQSSLRSRPHASRLLVVSAGGARGRFRHVAWVGAVLAGLAGCAEPGGDDVEPAPSCSERVHRIDTVDLADTWGDATVLGLDLDGDGDKDNKLGSLNATLTQVYGDWRPEDAIAELLATPALGWMMKVGRCEGSTRVEVSLGVGEDRDGDGVFAVADWGEPAVGEGYEARGGVGFLPVGRLGDGAAVGGDGGWAPELGLTVTLRPASTGVAATVGFGVEVTDALLAPVARFLSEALAAGDSRFAAGIDLDRDGVVSVAELRAAPAVRTLLASDLDLVAPCGAGDCYEPGRDGVADRISLGFGLHAVE